MANPLRTLQEYGQSVWLDFVSRDLLKSGELKYREDIVDGLEKAPAAFLGLLQGKNFGKMLVRVAP